MSKILSNDSRVMCHLDCDDDSDSIFNEIGNLPFSTERSNQTIWSFSANLSDYQTDNSFSESNLSQKASYQGQFSEFPSKNLELDLPNLSEEFSKPDPWRTDLLSGTPQNRNTSPARSETSIDILSKTSTKNKNLIFPYGSFTEPSTKSLGMSNQPVLATKPQPMSESLQYNAQEEIAMLKQQLEMANKKISLIQSQFVTAVEKPLDPRQSKIFGDGCSIWNDTNYSSEKYGRRNSVSSNMTDKLNAHSPGSYHATANIWRDPFKTQSKRDKLYNNTSLDIPWTAKQIKPESFQDCFTWSPDNLSNTGIYEPGIHTTRGFTPKPLFDSDCYDTVFSQEMYYNIKYYNEPLNYRKLLEKSASCNWKMIVDRIVLDNDQQASIFLQQKLKISNTEQRASIISGIVGKSYELMINRFGNFLMQRCLEYGNPAQVISLTDCMIGKICQLSMDPFGCHVIQKALDCVNENMKKIVVEEMLETVTETIVHRYACHVWQKLFELRWEGTPPKFMDKVNENLKGMWAQVAVGETGSLVVQNIFENCTTEDKDPCINEVIENIGIIIKGQWGNWVIQHMVEYAKSPYRKQIVESIIENSPIYSVDQFASKAVEKLLKMGETDVIQSFIDKVTEPAERPRIPLIDIASDAHGNYLIQYILQCGTKSQQEQIASQIKKHMVSLRGSKWGSKCAWLVDRSRASTSVAALSKAMKESKEKEKKKVAIANKMTPAKYLF